MTTLCLLLFILLFATSVYKFAYSKGASDVLDAGRKRANKMPKAD